MIFTKFENTDIVSGRTSQVSSGFFNNGSLTFNQKNMYYNDIAYNIDTSNPLNVKQSEYFLNVYSDNNSNLLFSVAYGDYANTGSSVFDYKDILTDSNLDIPESMKVPVFNNETKVIYSQYKNILLQPGDEKFSFRINDSYVDKEAIFVINFAADKMKDQIDPGQLQINFAYNTGTEQNPVYKVLSLIDDSVYSERNQNVYNLVRGEIKEGVPHAKDVDDNNQLVYEGFGLFYPKNGVIILNAEALNNVIKIITYTDNNVKTIADWRAHFNNGNDYDSESDLTYKRYYRIWTKNLIDNMRLVDSYSSGVFNDVNLYVRKSEFVPSTTYFIRVKNQQYNYSNNPTFVSDGTDGQVRGTIIYPELIDNPSTYVTTVGLYNDNNELMAVGKLSAPWRKTFDDEMLIKCKIDF